MHDQGFLPEIELQGARDILHLSDKGDNQAVQDFVNMYNAHPNKTP